MPMVGGKKFPYTDDGKMKAKKAALKMLSEKKAGKKSFSGVKSQTY
jgi:hypothetical protein